MCWYEDWWDVRLFSFDAILSCICDYFCKLAVHPAIAVLHGQSFSPVSLCLIVAQWLKQCESISLDYYYSYTQKHWLIDLCWYEDWWDVRLFSFDAILSCICDYFCKLAVHPAIAVLHGQSFSPVSLCLIVAQWLKQCESIIVLCVSCFLSLSLLLTCYVTFSTDGWFQFYFMDVFG